MAPNPHLIERSGDLKQDLVRFARRLRFRRALFQFTSGDQMIHQYCTKPGPDAPRTYGRAVRLATRPAQEVYRVYAGARPAKAARQTRGQCPRPARPSLGVETAWR